MAKEAVIESTATVGVLIVDDQAPFRDVARTVVRLSPGFEVVAEAASGEEAVAAALGAGPAGADGHQPPRDQWHRSNGGSSPSAPTTVILLSTTADDLPTDARSVGASQYVRKEDFSPAVLRGPGTSRLARGRVDRATAGGRRRSAV
jgi:DNA-binding NarL/FixJ family response regulator